jgi:hypothetical protein
VLLSPARRCREPERDRPGGSHPGRYLGNEQEQQREYREHGKRCCRAESVRQLERLSRAYQ